MPKKVILVLLLAALTLPPQAICVGKIASTKVIRMVDGDTLKVRYKGIEEGVKLIEIDPPESRPKKELGSALDR